MVARLTGDLGIKRIAVLYQDDSFGRAGYHGARRALERRGMEAVAVGLYPRNTTAVKTALLDLRMATPEAVILVGAYEPVATFIAWARHIGMGSCFHYDLFRGQQCARQAVGPRRERASTSPRSCRFQPTTTSAWRLPTAGHSSTFEPGAAPGFVSFEGYLAGRLAIAALQRCGQDVNRASFLNSLRSTRIVDIDGFELQYGSKDNQGSDAVFLTMIGRDGRYYPIDTLQEAAP